MAFWVIFSLSNLFIIINSIPTNIIVIAYASKLIFQSPFAKFAPTIVEDITDGNLANVEIHINLIGFNGNNPAIYTNKSFGVPGNINNMTMIISIFLGF